MSDIKYLITDVDGSLTDGKIYIGNDGEIMKAFSVKDGYALSNILPKHGIEPIILTCRSSEIVLRRCEELGIKKVIQGVSDKKKALSEIVQDGDLSYCAYFGDDIPDLDCMKAIKHSGGIVGCPTDAANEIKSFVDYVCLNKAGEGALREFTDFVERSLARKNDIEQRVFEAVEYIKHLDADNLHLGKYTVNNDFYYTVQEYFTKSESECKMESHRKYIDIQYIVDGSEIIKISDISRLEQISEYDSENDIMFWKPEHNTTSVGLTKGSMIVLYPNNAHMGCVMRDEVRRARKIVGKVRI